MTDTHATGRCLCGRVEFRIELPTDFLAHCHCESCRRSHGAAFVSWTGVPHDRFELVRGEDDLRWYRSSEWILWGFCGNCGSSMLYRADRPGHRLAEGHLDASPLTPRPVFGDRGTIAADEGERRPVGAGDAVAAPVDVVNPEGEEAPLGARDAVAARGAAPRRGPRARSGAPTRTRARDGCRAVTRNRCRPRVESIGPCQPSSVNDSTASAATTPGAPEPTPNTPSPATAPTR